MFWSFKNPIAANGHDEDRSTQPSGRKTEPEHSKNAEGLSSVLDDHRLSSAQGLDGADEFVRRMAGTTFPAASFPPHVHDLHYRRGGLVLHGQLAYRVLWKELTLVSSRFSYMF